MNLTRRFSLSHGSIAALAVLVTLGVMIGGANRFFWNQIRQSQQKQMQDFSLAVREAYFANEDVATLNFIRLTVKDPMVAFAALTDVKGKVQLALPIAFRKTDMTPGSLLLPDGRRLSVLTSPVAAGEEKIGTVVIGYDQGKLDKLVHAQVLQWVELGVLAGACALLLAFFLSVLLAKNLVRPLKRIRVGTDQVRAGKLDKLVEVERSDEIGDLARDFNAMVVKLKELEAMKRDFVAGVTHDFGTPLHAIKNALEFLEEKKAGPLNGKQTEYLLMISNNVIQLNAFITNLLTTASIEAAKVEPFYEPLDALAQARDIVNLYQAEARQKGVDLRLAGDESSLFIMTDATMFRQILVNLISNALKYTLEGSVHVDLSNGNGVFTLKVSDTGIGISPEHQGLIFDKFFRIRQAKNFPVRQGTGLGLAIAKGLAEAMGGSIRVESELGRGSTFTVTLPRHSATLNEMDHPIFDREKKSSAMSVAAAVEKEDPPAIPKDIVPHSRNARTHRMKGHPLSRHHGQKEV